MTQQKAASLSSSLFAHKGKASPASLLISELEAAGAESFGPGGQAAAANGRAGGHHGRRKPKPPAELPLLAFVEAQAPEEAGGEESGDEAATAAPAGEPAPAASLLERGARALRRTNGGRNGLANGPESAVPPAAEPANGNAAAAGGAPQGDAGSEPGADPGEIIEAETVSGDANVAAIEDAPQDDDGRAEAPAAKAPPAEAVPANAVPASAVLADPVTVDPGTADPVTVEAVAAGPDTAPNEAAAVAAPPAAPAMPASLALRQAAARRSVSSPPSEAAPLPPARAAVRVWRSAAALALGAVLGLGLYLALTGEPASPTIVAVPASPEPEATTSSAEPDATTSPAEPEATTSSAEPEATTSSAEPEAAAAPAQPPAAVEAALPEPSFDIIRIEPDGQSIIAGRAAPGSEWILLNNDSPIAAVRADANGEWVVLPDAALVPGANAFSLVPKAERGRISIPAPAAVPPETAPAEPAQSVPAIEAAPPAGPRADAAPPALPRPKPQAATAAAALAPAVFQAAAAGAYEVQLASVRQSGDANRERLRLAAAHPKLLGAMDLRVQEARLDGAGVFYRVRSGAIGDLGVARDLCRRLEAAGQGCLVVRRPEAPASDVAEDVPDAATAVRQQAERPR